MDIVVVVIVVVVVECCRLVLVADLATADIVITAVCIISVYTEATWIWKKCV